MRQMFSQIVSRPVAALAAGFELLGHRLKSGQRIDGIVSRIIHTLSRASGGSDDSENRSSALIAEREKSRVEAAIEAQSEARGAGHIGAALTPSGQGVSEAPVAPANARGADAEAASRSLACIDTDLSDETLKLVSYRVLFVRRGYEHAFGEKEELLEESLDGVAFTAWKIAEFMQELKSGEIPAPEAWREKNYPPPERMSEGRMIDLPPEDKKYLRLQYRVLDRFPRGRFKHEERQIRILEQIRDAMAKGGE